MKAYMYKPWDRLPPSQKETIARVKEQEINEYFAKVQKNMLMLQCIAMDKAGLTVEQCLLVLANMREVYRQNSKILSDSEQQAWLNSEMDRIFGKDNYPYEYIDKLEEM